MTGLSELAARVEAAEGPDIYLDADIRDAFGLGHDYTADWRGWGFDAGGKPIERPKAFPYTASLDAAMTLVPEDWTAWQLRSRRRKTRFVATVARLVDDIDEDYDEQEVVGHAATPALALTAAALRARASGEGEGGSVG